jgi:flagellar basal body-associated protein FliL
MEPKKKQKNIIIIIIIYLFTIHRSNMTVVSPYLLGGCDDAMSVSAESTIQVRNTYVVCYGRWIASVLLRIEMQVMTHN